MKATSYFASGAMGCMQSGTLSGCNTKRANSVNKRNDKKAPKKKLNYNPREIRSLLLQAKKAQSASKVACQAQSKLSNLAKCKGTGMYDEAQLSSAIIHAKRMVQCAKMKARNLRQEEDQQRKAAKKAKAEEQAKKREIKHKISQKEHEIEQREHMEKSQRIARQHLRNQELARRRRMHRSFEKGKMDEADEEYKKNMNAAFTGGEQDLFTQMAYYPTAGVEVRLSGTGLELTEAQLEQQAEMMAEASIGITAAGGSGSVDMPAAGAMGGAAPVIDVVVDGV